MAGTDWRQAQRAFASDQGANSDAEYFRRRETQERIAARRSTDLRVRRAHLEMAMRYDALVKGVEANCGTELRLVP